MIFCISDINLFLSYNFLFSRIQCSLLTCFSMNS